MPTISSCPFCQAQVAVPQSAAPADEVRCPLCQAQFSLEDTLDIALPELIVVRSSAAATLRPELVGAGTAANGDAWHSGTSFGMPVYRPGDSVGFDMSPGGGIDMGPPLETAFAAGLASPPPTTGEEFFNEPGAANLEAAWASSDPAALDEFASETATATIDTGVEPVDPTDAGIVAKPRKKKKEANMAIEMVKAMLGGAVGLFVAYMILMWSLKNWDPLRIAPKLPAFMVPERLER